jgi:hypothetical protein
MQRERIEQYIEMYEEVQNSEELKLQCKMVELYMLKQDKIESTTVQYSWQCTVILLRVQYI